MRVNIEEAFPAVVKKCGGTIVSDIVGKSPPFANADYLFPQDKVVAELKCLSVDKSNDPAIQKRTGELWIKWGQQGLVQGEPPPAFNSHILPKSCQNELLRMMGESIKRSIQKANAQIRATKSALNLHDHQGVVLLANDGNLIFEMPAVMHLIFLTIRDHFHDVDCVVFFSGNMVSLVAGVERPARFWIGLERDDTVTSVANLTNRLSLEWGAHYAFLSGIAAQPGEIGDMEFFSRPMVSHLG